MAGRKRTKAQLADLLAKAEECIDTPPLPAGRKCGTCQRHPEGTDVHTLLAYYVERITAGTNRASVESFYYLLKRETGYALSKSAFREHLRNCLGVDTGAVFQ